LHWQSRSTYCYYHWGPSFKQNTRLRILDKDKHSSLFILSFTDEEESFKTLAQSVSVTKLFSFVTDTEDK
jgi:hypothetical protein